MPSHPQPQPTVGGHIAVVRANMDLTAQLDDELSFHTGDVINVLQVMDSDFCLGECNGRTGQFPVWCVDVLEGNLNASMPKEEKRRSKFHKWWEEEANGESSNQMSNSQNSQPSYNQSAAPLSFNKTNAPKVAPNLSLPIINTNDMTSQSQTVKNHIENIKNEFIQNDNNNTTFEKTHKRSRSYTMESIRSYDSSVTPYGRTLFPFIAENPNELTFFDNEIVVLIRYVDEQWMEGENKRTKGNIPNKLHRYYSGLCTL